MRYAVSGQGSNPEANPVPVGALIAQPHGGSIKHGSTIPGPGRPASLIRKRARESYDARMEFLERVADGEMLETRVQPPGAAEPTTIRRSADISDRMKAMRELREVGLGTIREISFDEVKQRLADTVALLRDRLGDEAEPLIRELEPIWRTKK